jgi:hypothetical protein
VTLALAGAPGVSCCVATAVWSTASRLRYTPPSAIILGAVWEPAPEAVLARPVFAVADHTFSWREVLLAARLWGEWERCERAAAAELTLIDAQEGAAAPEDHDLETRERAFRAEWSLQTTEELDAWLDRWQLRAADWREHLRGRALRERGQEPGRAAEGEAPVAGGVAGRLAHDPERLVRAAWTLAVCERRIDASAHLLASAAAAASASGMHLAAGGVLTEAELAEIRERYQRFCRDAATPRALEREVELRSLDWLQFELRYVETDDEEVAREAALCMREEKMDMREVAATAGIELHSLCSELDAIDRSLRSQLLGARPGSLIGPLQVGGCWQLVEVLERRAPSPADPALGERAAAAAVEGALEVEVINRVHWHERL